MQLGFNMLDSMLYSRAYPPVMQKSLELSKARLKRRKVVGWLSQDNKVLMGKPGYTEGKKALFFPIGVTRK